jgi:hypothetical protein
LPTTQRRCVWGGRPEAIFVLFERRRNRRQVFKRRELFQLAAKFAANLARLKTYN